MCEKMNIALSLNSKYVRYAYVMLTSLLENNAKDLELYIYFLHSELTEEERKCLGQLVESHGGQSTFLCVNKERFPKNCPVTEWWSLEAYYRLLLPELLPEETERILYLDVDIIVNKSVEDLFHMDFEDALLCACEDSNKAPFSDRRDIIFEKQIQEGFTYFCSGVLLMNIKKLKENYCFDDYMKLADFINYGMVAPDQDLLNLMHYREVKFFDGNKYNLFAKVAYNHDVHYEEVKAEVAIIHFAGPKPWQGQHVHYDIEQLWWDYAKKTPFYHELMEEYLYASLNDSTVYDTMMQSLVEKKQLQSELQKSVALCQRLASMLQEK